MQKIRVTYTSDRSYLVSTSPRIIARYSLLKRSAAARLQSVYFGFSTLDDCNRFAAEFRLTIGSTRIDIRKARRTNAQFEVKISNIRVADMAIVERFCKALINAVAAPKAARVIQFPQSTAKPIAVGQSNPPGRIRPKLAKDHMGRTTIAGIHID